MYFLIKYGGLDSTLDDQILYINPDCILKFILEYIREATCVDGEYDLCDESGQLLYINECEPNIHGTDVLKPFQTYIIVLIEKLDGVFTKLTPLLSTISSKKSDYNIKLRKYINPSKRFSYELKKSRQSSERR